MSEICLRSLKNTTSQKQISAKEGPSYKQE